jgi:hypothetical protein
MLEAVQRYLFPEAGEPDYEIGQVGELQEGPPQNPERASLRGQVKALLFAGLLPSAFLAVVGAQFFKHGYSNYVYGISGFLTASVIGARTRRVVQLVAERNYFEICKQATARSFLPTIVAGIATSLFTNMAFESGQISASTLLIQAAALSVSSVICGSASATIAGL